MQQDQPLKIIQLTAENVKKPRAVQITPEGHIFLMLDSHSNCWHVLKKRHMILSFESL